MAQAVLQRVLQRPVRADGVEETLTEILSGSGSAEEFFVRVCGCYDRAQTEVSRSTSSAELKTEVLQPAVRAILKQAALGLLVPDLFGLDFKGERAGAVFGRVSRCGKVHVLTLARILETLLTSEDFEEAQTSEFLSDFVCNVVQEICSRRNASFSSSGEAVGEVNLLTILLSQMTQPEAVKKLGERVCAADDENGAELTRLLVALLQPALTDHVLVYNDRTALSKSPKHQYYARLSKTTVNELGAAENQLRSLQNGNIELALSLVNRLLRASDVCRQAVLETLGRLSCERGWPRSTLGWQQQFAPHAMGLYEHLFKTPQLGGSLERFRALVHLTKPNNLASGLAVNLASLILELILPIKAQTQASTISAFCLSEGGDHKPQLMSGSGTASQRTLRQMLQEARMAPKDAVREILASKQAQAGGGGFPFKEGIFWVGVGAMHSLLLPALKEAELCIQVASMMHREQKAEGVVDDAYGEWQCFETLLLNGKLVQSVGHLLNLTMMVVLKSATQKKTVAEWLDLCFDAETSTELADELALIPAFVLDDVIELLVSYKQLFEAARQPLSLLTNNVDPDVYIAFLVYILGSDALKNPQIRGKAAGVLHNLVKTDTLYAHRLRETPFSTRNILPACIRVFTAVEKTKQSFYDIRFHVKFQLRMPIQELFEQLLPVEGHRKALVNFATVQHQDEFVKFVNQLLNDTAYLLDEGLDTLLKIRRGELTQPPQQQQPQQPPQPQPGQQQHPAEDEDENENNSRSVQDPKEHCRMYNKLAKQTLSTLHTICKESSSVIVENRVLLEQLITSCVDPVLDRLVGPRALELKGETRDFELFDFDPKYLLNRIAELYVFLARPNEDRVRKIVAEDLRYYKPETFRKAVNILRRERLLSGALLKEFEQFVQRLNEFATQQKSALDSVEIPDEYLDPLMASIMADPVLLPTSGNVLDRATITRIILSDDHDPFNRLPLRLEDLVPQTALKTRIRAFCQLHNIHVDEDAAEGEQHSASAEQQQF